MLKTSIVCLIYKSTKYLEFVYQQILKYTNLENTEFYFVANDASQDVIEYLKTHNIAHYIFTNSPENIAAHNVSNYYLDNVYRAWNTAAKMAKGEYIVFINSESRLTRLGYMCRVCMHKAECHTLQAELVTRGSHFPYTDVCRCFVLSISSIRHDDIIIRHTIILVTPEATT